MDQSTPSTSKKRFTTFFKWISIVVGSLLLLVVAAYIVLVSFLDDYLKAHLPEKVRKSSNGLYALAFDGLDVNWNGLAFSVNAHNIRFTTDSTQWQAIKRQQSTPPPSIRITADSLYISRLTIWPLLWGKGIHIPTIQISQPSIYTHIVAGKNKPQKPKPILLKLHEQLSDYAAWVYVDSINVHEGSLHYVKTGGSGKMSADIPAFSLGLYDVFVDEKAKADTNRVLYTKNIILRAADGISINTSLYQVRTNYMHVSTATGSRILNIQVETDSVAVAQQASAMHVNGAIPEVTIGYIDWRQMLNAEGLYISAIHLAQPALAIQKPRSTSAQASGKPSSQPLHETISSFTPSLQVDFISVKEGKLQYNHQPNARQFLIEKFDLMVDDLRIDSTAAHDEDRFLYAKDVQLLVQDQLQVIDGLYTMHAEYLKASTRSGLAIEGIRVRTDTDALRHRPQANRYEASIPAIHVHFTDWGAIMDSASLHIPLIRITQPSIRVVGRGSGKSQSQQSGPDKRLYQLISRFTPQLTIDRIQLVQGNVTYQQASQAGTPTYQFRSFALQIKDVQIDSATAYDKSRTFYSQHIALTVNGYARFTSPRYTLHIPFLQASTRQGITVKNVDIYTDSTALADSSTYFRAHIASIRSGFTNWDALLNDTRIAIPGIYIQQPQLTVRIPEQSKSTVKSKQSTDRSPMKYPQQKLHTLHQQLPSVLTGLQIDSIHISDGQITLQQGEQSNETVYSARQVELNLQDIHLDSLAAQQPERVLYSQNIRIAVHDGFHYRTQKQQLSIAQLKASTTDGIEIVDAHFQPTPEVLAGTRSKPAFEARVPRLSVAFTNWNDFIHAQPVSIPGIFIDHPAIEMIAANTSTGNAKNTKDQSNAESQDRPESNASVRKMVTQLVPSLHIDSIYVHKGTFHYEQHPSQTNQFPYEANDFFLTFDGIQIDSAADEQSDRLFYADDIRLRVKEYRQLFKDSLYKFELENAYASSAERILTVESLHLNPRYPKMEFYQRASGQPNMVDLSAAQLTAQGFDYNALANNQALISELISGKGLELNLFVNRKYLEQGSSNRRLPLEAFRQMNTYVRFDSIHLEESYIRYTEVLPKEQDLSTLFFENVQADLQNVTNDSSLVSLTNPAIFRGEALLMGSGRINLQMEFPIFSDTAVFAYVGSIGRMDLTTLNPALEEMAGFRIRNGILDELTVQSRAGQDEANGIMCAFYRNLEVEVLQDGSPEADESVADFTTFLANRFLVINDNRRRGWRFNPGYIKVNSKENEGVFHYFWSTVRNGLMGSTGYKRAKRWIPFL